MSYNDLIADYIIKQGIELTSEFNYTISLDDLEKDFDKELFTYVKNNMDDIFNSISSDERVAEVILTDNSFDMVYYWSYCLDENEKLVLEIANSENIELEYEEVVELGMKLWNYDKDERDKYVLEQIKERNDELER
ncbi:MAG: hypothetical protein J6A89_03650 [Clostridia bacterium]|nr:hypothetical protein [Clostridia bacterium]MBO5375536.1 hypothetical protein [Bacilli bacterium]